MFDMVNLLTSGGPGSTTELASITLKREAFEKWRTGYSSAFAIVLFVTVFGLANIYVKALNRVKNREGTPEMLAHTDPRPLRRRAHQA
jgi:multiple sugar transport system permease protein